MDNITPLYKNLSVPESFGFRLKEGRVARGFTNAELAELVGVTPQAISQYELGQTTPRGDVLAKICSTLDLPLGFFIDEGFSNEPPEGPIFFRSLKSASSRSQDMMKMRSKWSWRLFSYFDKFINFPAVKKYELQKVREPGEWTLDEIENLAADVRRFWGLGMGPISDVTRLMENNGVIISRAYFGDVKLDAFSQWRGNRPFMFLSADKESAVRSRFDQAHENGHLILHSHINISEIKDSRRRSKMLSLIEKEANMFASALLMPADSFGKEVYSSSLSHFINLKRRWKVSIAAMVYRCESLGIISDNQALYLRKQMASRKMRTFEPLDDELPIESPTLLSTAIKMLIENGVQTPRDVAEAVKLPYSDVENLCNLSSGFLQRDSSQDKIINIQFRTEQKTAPTP